MVLKKAGRKYRLKPFWMRIWLFYLLLDTQCFPWQEDKRSPVAGWAILEPKQALVSKDKCVSTYQSICDFLMFVAQDIKQRALCSTTINEDGIHIWRVGYSE